MSTYLEKWFFSVLCMRILHYVGISGSDFFSISCILYYVDIIDSAVSFVVKMCMCNVFVCGNVQLFIHVFMQICLVRIWLLCSGEKRISHFFI